MDNAYGKELGTSVAEEFAEEVGAEVLSDGPGRWGYSDFVARYRGYDVHFSGVFVADLDTFIDHIEGMGGVPPVATTVLEAPGAPTTETEFVCPQIRFSRTDSGRYEIQFFKVLGDNSLSQWPEVRHTAEQMDAWAILEPVLNAEQAALLGGDLPAKIEGDWLVSYKIGRATGKLLDDGSPSYYKDLVLFENRR